MKLTRICAVVTVLGFTGGCATQGGEGFNLAKAVDSVSGVVGSAVGSASSVMGGVLEPYRSGVHVPNQVLSEIKPGMSAQQVESMIGMPPSIETSNGTEIWSYPYTEITHFSGNTNETTVVRFDTQGKVVKAYKAAGRSGSTGNALVDAANAFAQ